MNRPARIHRPSAPILPDHLEKQVQAIMLQKINERIDRACMAAVEGALRGVTAESLMWCDMESKSS